MRALLFVPGLMGIALVVGGFTSDNDVMIGVGFGLAGFMVVSIIFLGVRDASAENAERRRIWKTGMPATARVIAITEIDSDDRLEVDLELDVRAEGIPSRTVKVRSLISRIAVPRIQPGCEFPVRLDAAGGNRVVIDPALTPYRMD
jgi:hypothetical protein